MYDVCPFVYNITHNNHMERIRLQRKFNMKSKIDPTERVGLIMQMMVLFWLALIVINSILTFSFRVHINQVFTG